ncbi:hypothetical protein [Microvirga antarctica]|uniref:hypothetical protein n=1 Tax=Microvirga antarctica TaxID=2819233 RepID=UPI001B30DDE4|nr:hypothetical protein [Microvirga antarctica]
MKQIALTLAAAVLMAGCVSSNAPSREPNYVQSQIYQSPMPVTDNFGSNDLPPTIGGLR